MSDDDLAALVVSTGWIAQRVHLPWFSSQASRASLVAVCDTNEGKMRSEAARYGVTGYNSLARALRHPHDVTVICTPGRDHARPVADALRSGRHVICEKPLAMDADEAKRLYAVADDRQRQLLVCMTNRFRGDVRAMREHVLSGHIGEVGYVRASWLRHAAIPRTAGGRQPGVLWDLGSHLVDLVLWITRWRPPFTVASIGPWTCRVVRPRRARHGTANMIPRRTLHQLATPLSWRFRLPTDAVPP
jgi:predicted dehydrogenase